MPPLLSDSTTWVQMETTREAEARADDTLWQAKSYAAQLVDESIAPTGIDGGSL